MVNPIGLSAINYNAVYAQTVAALNDAIASAVASGNAAEADRLRGFLQQVQALPPSAFGNPEGNFLEELGGSPILQQAFQTLQAIRQELGASIPGNVATPERALALQRDLGASEARLAAVKERLKDKFGNSIPAGEVGALARGAAFAEKQRIGRLRRQLGLEVGSEVAGLLDLQGDEFVRAVQERQSKRAGTFADTEEFRKGAEADRKFLSSGTSFAGPEGVQSLVGPPSSAVAPQTPKPIPGTAPDEFRRRKKTIQDLMNRAKFPEENP